MLIVFEWMLLEILLTIAMLQMNHHLDEGCHWQRERRMGTRRDGVSAEQEPKRREEVGRRSTTDGHSVGLTKCLLCPRSRAKDCANNPKDAPLFVSS